MIRYNRHVALRMNVEGYFLCGQQFNIEGEETIDEI